MSRSFLRHKIAALGATCFLLAAVGAYAYWTTAGSGSGSAATGTTDGLTVNQTSTLTPLYPGGAAQPLSGDFDNPNDGPIRVATVTVSLGSIEGSPAGCSIADYQINDPIATVDADIDPGYGMGSWSGPSLEMLDTAGDQNGCQDVTVNLVYVSD